MSFNEIANSPQLFVICGAALREVAMEIPRAIRQHTELTREEAEILYRLLYKILAHVDERNEREAMK